MNSRRVLTLIASLIVSAVFLGLALNSVDLQKLSELFSSADYRFVVFAAFSTFSGYVLRAARWRRFIAPSKVIPLQRVFPILVIGFALNNLLPGRPGELARAYGLGKREGLSKMLGLATVIVERVMDGLALIAFLLLALAAFGPLHLELPLAAEQAAVVAGVLFIGALAALLFMLMRESIALGVARWITRRLPRIIGERLERMYTSFVLGLHSLRSATDVASIGLLSGAVWCCEAFSYFCILTAFGALPNDWGRIVAAAFMMVIINLGIMIPAAPGGLGPFEAAGVFALGAFGLSETNAAGVALTAHAMQYLLITGLGILLLWREGIASIRVSEPPGETGQ